MRRTTLALDEDTLRVLKRRAAAAGTSLQSLANDLLRQALAARPSAQAFRLRLPPGCSARLQPGIDIADRDRLFEVLDGRG